MYSALTYDVMKSYLTRVRDKKKFVMAILHWKQGLLCDKGLFYWNRFIFGFKERVLIGIYSQGDDPTN